MEVRPSPPHLANTLVHSLHAAPLPRCSYGREWGSLIPGAPSSIIEERDLRRRKALELTTTNMALTGGAAGDHPMFTTTTKDQLRDGERPSVEAGLDKKTRARLVQHAYGLAPPDASPLPPSLGSTLATLRATGGGAGAAAASAALPHRTR